MVSIAVRLGELRERVMFLGGAVLGLLVDAPSDVRPTEDVDVVIDLRSQVDRVALDAQLLALGFRPDRSEGAPICRWCLGDLKLDIMPTDAAILGFSNRWYAEALATATPREVAPGVRVKVVGAPYFVATKLEAFFSRGGADFMASHDLEDIIAVIDGRDALIDEVRAASPELRTYLATAFVGLLETPAFIDALPGHLQGDAASQARLPLLLQRLRAIAATSRYAQERSSQSTVFHAAYWAHSLHLAHPRDQVVSLTRSLGNARVDLNPHQIGAALFALQSPWSRGVLLADEVGLGKTIEAGLVMAQKWAERRQRILLIAPATLRKQWQLELLNKFFLPSVILEAKTWNDRARVGAANPFEHAGAPAVVICSYQFAYAKRAELKATSWDLVVIDEAHRLRNVYKGDKAKTALGIADAIADRRKVLLTATPLQNSLLELHGLVSILDSRIFGDLDQFQDQFVRLAGFANADERDAALRERIAPVCRRTLRRDVVGFVNFTNREAVTATFTNSPAEDALYNEVSAFLQREELLVLPNAQRPLLTLVLRKLLASSTRAISATLAKFVARIEGDELIDDYEVPDDPASDDPSSENQTVVTVEVPCETLAPSGASASSGELNDLRRFIAMAEGVARDSKAETLLAKLPEVLAAATARGARRKAVIFTESRKTQTYLAELLTEHGFRGQVVLLNGTNTDATSKQIYTAYKARHQARWAQVSSGSKTADMKAAIVEEFESDRATILLATESAAEGVNLQFCSVVVNYDLPWNPQRIEQRIGRCHRYGQRADVVVVNFLNTSNQADRRVYELLSQKLQLFAGVFGASDDVLGATAAAGLDFERTIADIYQRCRTTDEINAAFDVLQDQLDDVIADGRRQARQDVLNHLDASVHATLSLHRDQAKQALDSQQQHLLDLVRFAWSGRATFAADAPRFTLDDAGLPRAFNLDWKDADDRDEEFFRVDHPLAVELIDNQARTELAPEEVIFTYSPHASALGDYVGTAGWLELVRLTVMTVERPEQFMLVVACDDAGREIPADVASRLFSLDGQVAGGVAASPPEALATYRGAAAAVRIAEAAQRSQAWLAAEAEKIDRRTEDEKQAVTRRLAALEAEVKAAQKVARATVVFDEQVAAKRRYEGLKRQLDAARRNQYDEIERLEDAAERVTAEMQRALRERTVTETAIATIRWRLVSPTTPEP